MARHKAAVSGLIVFTFQYTRTVAYFHKLCGALYKKKTLKTAFKEQCDIIRLCNFTQKLFLLHKVLQLQGILNDLILVQLINMNYNYGRD